MKETSGWVRGLASHGHTEYPATLILSFMGCVLGWPLYVLKASYVYSIFLKKNKVQLC